MECVAIRHVLFEDLGVWEAEIRAHGYQITYLDAGVDDLAPAADADLTIVLGGPIGVEDIDEYPVLRVEMDLLRSRLEANKPTVGVCLGAQLIAVAAGGRVYQDSSEIGWDHIQLTPSGALSSLGNLEGVPTLHWHRDTFDLPPEAVLLASTEATTHQAFAIGKVLGIQFHPEADGHEIERWLMGHAFQLADSSVDIVELRRRSSQVADEAAAAGVLMIRQWLRAVA